MKNLEIAGKCTFQHNCVIHLGGFDWCERSGSLRVGKDSIFGYGTVIMAAGPGGVTIGDNFDGGPGVKIFSSRSDYENRGKHVFAPVTIGDQVILYANVVVSPGVTIGKNAVIAAGSIVTDDIPEYAFAAGSPAKVIKYLKADK
jgi:maltose O-acetyltransferase